MKKIVLLFKVLTLLVFSTTLSAQCIITAYGTGSSGFSGDGSAAEDAQFNYPDDFAYDAAGNLYIADASNHAIRRVDAVTGIITTIAGTGTAGFSGDGGPGTSAQLSFTRGIAINAAGDLFIADSNNNRIRKVDMSTGIITTIAGIGPNQAVGSFGGDGGPATAANLNFPIGIVFNSNDELIFVDSNNGTIRKIDAAGIIQTIGSPFSYSLPQYLAIDGSDNLYVGDWLNGLIKKIDSATNAVTTFAGTGSFGYSGDGGLATAAQVYPYGNIILDAGGNLYFATAFGNNVVRRIDASTGIITTIAGDGTAGYSGDNGDPLDAQLSTPIGLEFAPNGDLLIADANNHVIRRIVTSCAMDSDGDGISDDDDNCPLIANGDQLDTDEDGEGDVCDGDDDNDGCLDGDDASPLVASGDADCDGVADDCDVCPGGDDSVDNNNDGLPDCAYPPSFEDILDAWKCSNNANNVKVLICHIPPGNPANAHTICVSEKQAKKTHLDKHGDYLGPCTSCTIPLIGRPEETFTVGKVEHLGMTVFPNPANDQITIRLEEMGTTAKQINIYNNLGSLVWKGQIGPGQSSLQVNLGSNRFQSGVYTVVTQYEGEVFTEKLVINK